MKKIHKTVFISSLAAIAGGSVATAVFAAGVSVSPAAPSGAAVNAQGAVTFLYSDATAKPMPLPMAKTAPAAMSAYAVSQVSGPPGVSPGAIGSGVMSPVNLSGGASAQDMASPLMVSPQEFGTSNHPFTTAPVDLVGTPANAVSLRYPYRATGKLYFKKPNGSSYVCSASLIKKGLIVTAAHCVTQYGGAGTRWYNSWQFVPAKYDGLAPYGLWNATRAWVMTAYYNGADSCATGAAGVVCRNDIAVLTVTPKSTVYPGTSTGWYGYGYNGYGFSGTNLALINQLGYPASHAAGLRMQRTDSQGFVSSTNVGNTVWGSRQTGGSSGGPELVNLSPIPGAVLSGAILLGAEPQADTVVGVTSWGYTNQLIKQQGASAFTNTNITALVSAACAAVPTAC